MGYLLAVRKGEDAMSMGMENLRRTVLLGVIGTLAVAGAVRVARADVASDKPGAILVFPKVVVDTNGVLGPPTDTEIQITNTTNKETASLHGIGVRCFIIDHTSHCSNDPDTACTLAGEADSATRQCNGGVCIQDNCLPAVKNERDFQMTLTKRQPISWKASEGLVAPLALPCDPLAVPPDPHGCSELNSGTVLPVPEDPFVGEIKCVEADPDTFAPIAGLEPANNYAGDLKGEATIVSVSTSGTTVDARKYNAIAIQSCGAGTNDGDDILTLGAPGSANGCSAGAEYNGCPKLLIVDNLFDDAPVVTHAGASTKAVTTDLTFVPCAEDILNQVPTGATLQFLVYNEFEQRFSTSMGFSCFKELQLSDIDSRPGPFGNAQSIFNIAVEGTLSGQIKIRPVAGAAFDNRVLGISEEFWSCQPGDSTCLASIDCPEYLDSTKRCSAAANVDLVQGEGNGDQLSLPPPK